MVSEECPVLLATLRWSIIRQFSMDRMAAVSLSLTTSPGTSDLLGENVVIELADGKIATVPTLILHPHRRNGEGNLLGGCALNDQT